MSDRRTGVTRCGSSLHIEDCIDIYTDEIDRGDVETDRRAKGSRIASK